MCSERERIRRSKREHVRLHVTVQCVQIQMIRIVVQPVKVFRLFHKVTLQFPSLNSLFKQLLVVLSNSRSACSSISNMCINQSRYTVHDHIATSDRDCRGEQSVLLLPVVCALACTCVSTLGSSSSSNVVVHKPDHCTISV
jgi:hypothetical protein